MEKLLPILRIMPVAAFLYGIIATGAELAELQTSADAAGSSMTYYTEVRVAYLAGIVECFDDLFFWWVMALLSLALVKFMNGDQNAHM